MPQLQEELSIPTVYQRLFYGGQELQDNTVTAAALGILADDVLDMREETEGGSDADDHSAPAKKKPREEGRGFGGTLLGGSSQPGSRSSVEAADVEIDSNFLLSTLKSCSACTFANMADASHCEMCDTILS